MFRSIVALFALLFGVFTSSGCVVYDSGSPPPKAYPPVLNAPYVGCDWDPVYSDYFWYFEVQASDPDHDLAQVGVDVFDRSGRYLESWELVPAGGNTYTATIYEYYSASLSCPYGGEFQVVFWGRDHAGYETRIDAPRYTNDAPVLSQPYVECGWDSYYGQSYWYFDVAIWDPQGVADIYDAAVWIYYAGGTQPVEAFDLFFDPSVGTWYTTVYEQYSAVLDCRYPGSFGFQFTAQDYAGNLSYVNATSVYAY